MLLLFFRNVFTWLVTRHVTPLQCLMNNDGLFHFFKWKDGKDISEMLFNFSDKKKENSDCIVCALARLHMILNSELAFSIVKNNITYLEKVFVICTLSAKGKLKKIVSKNLLL